MLGKYIIIFISIVTIHSLFLAKAQRRQIVSEKYKKIVSNYQKINYDRK